MITTNIFLAKRTNDSHFLKRKTEVWLFLSSKPFQRGCGSCYLVFCCYVAAATPTDAQEGQRKSKPESRFVLRAKSLQLCLTLFNPIHRSPPGSSCPWDSPGKNTGVGCHALLQRIFQPRNQTHVYYVYLRWQAGSLPLTLGSLSHGLVLPKVTLVV